VFVADRDSSRDGGAGVVLIVDDQPAVRDSLQMFFEVHKVASDGAAGPREALARIRRGGIAVVLQDMNFSVDTTSGDEGAALFREIRAVDPGMPVLLMTAWTSLEAAVALVKEGAADYLAKPWNDDKLLATVKTLLRVRELERENVRLRVEAHKDRVALASEHDLCGLVYASPRMHKVVSLALQIAPSDAPVLIRGANGAGKEKLAQIVQANSRRKGAPFVRVNAGALPEALLEGELFGTEAGAYTGATRARPGLFEAADGGTLFLDEIGNLPLAGQVKLLRVLQTGELTRLGSTTPRKTNVRVISATNADLARAIEDKTFREDLYFRLNMIELVVPDLRERPEDVLVLARSFLEAAGHAPRTFSEEAERALVTHGWPGNVRELENRVKRAVLVARDVVLQPEDLGLADAGSPPQSGLPVQREPEPSRTASREDIEGALDRHAGNVTKAAGELGLSRQALYRRMEKLDITEARKSRA
jgi:DNA-binding NtrC family response regulator